MIFGNYIVHWFILICLAYGLGTLVQIVLRYERDSVIVTLTIGAVGMLIGNRLPAFVNIDSFFNIEGIPIISSIISSFLIPGTMWLLRGDYRKKDSDLEN